MSVIQLNAIVVKLIYCETNKTASEKNTVKIHITK